MFSCDGVVLVLVLVVFVMVEAFFFFVWGLVGVGGGFVVARVVFLSEGWCRW